jgi:hypothetical protein
MLLAMSRQRDFGVMSWLKDHETPSRSSASLRLDCCATKAGGIALDAFKGTSVMSNRLRTCMTEFRVKYRHVLDRRMEHSKL